MTKDHCKINLSRFSAAVFFNRDVPAK